MNEESKRIEQAGKLDSLKNAIVGGEFSRQERKRQLSSDPLAMIAAERGRQVVTEGWLPSHDDQHANGELAEAAAGYALSPRLRRNQHYSCGKIAGHVPAFWPWDTEWWKPTPDDRIRELVKAGALIVAEIERLQRAATADAQRRTSVQPVPSPNEASDGR